MRLTKLCYVHLQTWHNESYCYVYYNRPIKINFKKELKKLIHSSPLKVNVLQIRPELKEKVIYLRK